MKKTTVRRTLVPLVLFAVIGLCFAAKYTVGDVTDKNPFYATAWSLLPPVISITLALLTKEVYSSLFIGIVVGGLMHTGFSFEKTVLHVFRDGILGTLTDGGKMSILVFVVILGMVVVLLNLSGGSTAFGRWVGKHVKSEIGLQLMTILLGVFLFIDDGFSCMTTGSVMRPVCDRNRISRAKLAYIIDATAAPICIIAPVSSWAAAVTGYVEKGNGLKVFIEAIPFNFYAILTVVMMLTLSVFKLDFGPMAQQHTEPPAETEQETDPTDVNGRVVDMLLPIGVLIIACIIGMIYTGGFFDGVPFLTAVSESDPAVGFIYGSALTLIFSMVYYGWRGLIPFKKMMSCLPKGFNLMVAPMLILIFAWTLKFTTNELGAGVFVNRIVTESAAGFQSFLPAIIFLIAALLSFSTGTSWGTFGILIPIVLEVFPLSEPRGIVCLSACLAGSVFGDHCSPISDTTIMASAGAQCDHVLHVSTQLPYALTVAAVSFVGYLIAGFLPNAWIVLPIEIVLMIGTIIVLKQIYQPKRGCKKTA